MNAISKGTRLKTGVDYFAKGFSPVQLNEAFYRLTADSRQGALLLECATFQEVDDEYNPGEEERLSTVEMVLEAVRVKAFSRTAQTMAALARAMNKQLAAAGTGFTIGEAIIGKPKKSGLFATVTVQLPVSDGQVISIIFHSPDNNKMKITASDEILAFRWLLNKRDITAVVSPDGAEADTLPGMDAAQDVSLEDVGKRCAMLIEKNATRFASTQKEIVEAKKTLEDLKAQADAETLANQQALNDLRAEQDAAAQADIDIKAAQDKLAKVTDYNDKLQSQLDALIAANAGNTGKAGGEDTTGGETQATKDAAEFEAKKAAFEQDLVGRGFEAKGAAFTLDSGAANLYIQLGKDRSQPEGVTYQIGARHYANLSSDTPTDQKIFRAATLAGLDKQVADALKWIDGKLAGMKDDEAQRKALADRAAEQQASEARVMEERRLTEVGKAAVPGIRPGDAKEAGVWYELLQKGEATQAQWEAYVEDLYSSNKATRPVATPDTSTDSPAITILNDILAGKYTDSTTIGDKLDEAAAEMERDGTMEANDALLNSAADYLTEILKKEAA